MRKKNSFFTWCLSDIYIEIRVNSNSYIVEATLPTKFFSSLKAQNSKLENFDLRIKEHQQSHRDVLVK